MILLSWDGSSASEPCVVLLFGSGLVGGAVTGALQRLAAGATIERLNWVWPEPSSEQVTAAESAVHAAIAIRPDTRLAVIWAAGLSGFGTSMPEMDTENEALGSVRALARRVAGDLSPARRSFVHVSSAGGLFEGQVACGLASVPAPLRPYGHGKLAQENAVEGDPDLGHRLIVRPSSVYGYATGGRRGLVPALVAAAIQCRDASIFGALTTQRDFVFAPDIGRYIAARVLAPWPKMPAKLPETVLLASGRPASVFEVIQLVEGYVGKALQLRIDPRPENGRDNTFLPSALPKGFQPTRLQEGIALTATAVTQERYGGAYL